VETLEQIKTRIESAVGGAKVEVVANPSPANQPSLLVDHEHAVAVATFLRDDPDLRFDLCSNVTGVDWLDRVVKKTNKVKKVVDGVEKEVVETSEDKIPGYLESVYHLFSIVKQHGPLVLRMRTRDRAEGVNLPSLTPVWRSAEFQEREIYDMFGIEFAGHPGLKRILLPEDWQGHPLRKDYDILKQDQAWVRENLGIDSGQ